MRAHSPPPITSVHEPGARVQPPTFDMRAHSPPLDAPPDQDMDNGQDLLGDIENQGHAAPNDPQGIIMQRRPPHHLPPLHADGPVDQQHDHDTSHRYPSHVPHPPT